MRLWSTKCTNWQNLERGLCERGLGSRKWKDGLQLTNRIPLVRIFYILLKMTVIADMTPLAYRWSEVYLKDCFFLKKKYTFENSLHAVDGHHKTKSTLFWRVLGLFGSHNVLSGTLPLFILRVFCLYIVISDFVFMWFLYVKMCVSL